MTTIHYHAEHCQEAKPAVDVKDHGVLYARTEPYASLIEEVGEDVANALYERAREGFWMDADVLADEYGYGEAYSEGRSGGWLVVSEPPVINTDGYGQVCASALPRAHRWEQFTQAIESAIDEARAYYVGLMREHLAAEQFERSESAQMAARDIVTVP